MTSTRQAVSAGKFSSAGLTPNAGLQRRQSRCKPALFLCGNRRGRLERQPNFLKLLRVNGGGGLKHEIASALVLRKGHDFADVLLVAEQHHQAVETKCDATMGGCAIFEGVKKRAEPLSELIAGISHQPENFFLVGALVKPDTAAADFETIEDDIVLLRAHLPRIGEQQVVIL